MNIERWQLGTMLLAPAMALFGMWWWRDRQHNKWIRQAVARRKRHAERWC